MATCCLDHIQKKNLPLLASYSAYTNQKAIHLKELFAEATSIVDIFDQVMPRLKGFITS